ncbi:MAG: hypothetical protein ACYDGR_01385 [Candidatus Dormibacteria bacterium]
MCAQKLPLRQPQAVKAVGDGKGPGGVGDALLAQDDQGPDQLAELPRGPLVRRGTPAGVFEARDLLRNVIKVDFEVVNEEFGRRAL